MTRGGSMEQQLKQQRKLYREKNEYLGNVLEAVSPIEFYRELFPEGSFERRGRYDDERGNGIGLIINTDGAERRATRLIVFDELDELKQLQKSKFAILAPVSYFGQRRTGRNAHLLYAMAFDLDGVGMPQLRDVIHQSNKEIIPQPTFIVNSGNGLHLYYVFKEPLPMYPHNQQCLRELKEALTRNVIWNNYTSTLREKQYQGIMQAFRVVGSQSKLGQRFPVKAYRFGGRVDVDYLIGFLPDSNGEQQRIQKLMKKGRISLEEAKKKYPDWYERRIVKRETQPRWTVKRDLYDWWFKRIYIEIGVGHRYFGIMTLAIYAAKCGISEEELYEDAFSLLEHYDSISETEDNRFTEEDIIAALEAYNESYVTFPRDEIAKLTGLQIKENKRNGRKQELHLKLARAQLKILKDAGEIKDGRGSLCNEIVNWRMINWNGTRLACVRETGISYPTVAKYWAIYDELQEEWSREEKRRLDTREIYS